MCFVFLKHPFSDSPFCLNVDEHLMVHGIHAIRYYSKTKFKMKCIVCSKLTVEIAQHYRWLCRHAFVVHFEQTIPVNIYLFKVNGRRLDKGVQFFFFFFFFYLGFLSRTFTNHRTAGEVGGHFFNSSLPLPPASQLDISQAITAESSPLHIAGSRT